MERTEVHGRRRLLDDFFKVDEAEVSFERADGSMTPPARRLVFERGDSVAAVVVHRESHSLLFTEQFRFPTLGKGSGWLLEVIAGMIDSGESPEAALRREIEEELGFAVARLEPISTFFVSPGGSSERIWLYYAEVTDSGRLSAGGGVAAEQEEIRIVRLSPDAAQAALREGRLPDAKTIIGLQWLFAKSLK
ncbi:MAG: NUDIX hydrolase [Candidatus Accumulibacter sp.]|uniref:GDP-mannose pyrophosphatase n=1 Tax=Candidatus Accumulibacter affinis TaxID=2954384 RepID=A0A935T700_9PROT|nr:NUDIX hydrolase [Candidatus Accumulibacter affinis]